MNEKRMRRKKQNQNNGSQASHRKTLEAACPSPRTSLSLSWYAHHAQPQGVKFQHEERK
jgi:hypothetical protein